MSNLIIAVMITLYSFQATFCNLFAKQYPGKKEFSSPVYSVFFGLIITLGSFIFSGFTFHPSRPILILGAICGVVIIAYNTLLIRASILGPFSITMIFNMSGAILIPLFWTVLQGDPLSVWQIFAIIVMVVSLVLLNLEDRKKEEDGEKAGSGKVSLRFLLTICFLGFVNGMYGILMDAGEKASGGAGKTDMIVMTYGVSTVLALILLVLRAGRDTLSSFRQTGKSALSLFLSCMGACAAANLLMFALSLVNPAVLYAMDNGGVLVVSVLWSALILKEKMSKWKFVGLILALGAIVALSVL